MDKKKIGAGLLAMFVSLLPLAAQQSAERSGKEMDRISICQDNYRALFGGEALTGQGNDREMMDILQKFIFGEVFTAGPLEVKTRELITCTVLTTIQTLPQLKAHAAAALRVGVSPVELHEAVYQCAPFIGFPRTLNALSVLEQVFQENGIDLPLPPQGTVNEENRYEKGREIQQRLYGDRMARQLSGVPGGLDTASATSIPGVVWTCRRENCLPSASSRLWMRTRHCIPTWRATSRRVIRGRSWRPLCSNACRMSVSLRRSKR